MTSPSALCEICLEPKPTCDVIKCESGHTLCSEDVRRLYENAIKEGAPVPPICCQNNLLPIRQSILLLSDEVADNVLKHIEKLELEATQSQPKENKGTGLAESGEFLLLAKEKQYQNCPKCHRWIEKTGGCDHIHCICGEQLCYRCGAVDGRCNCSFDIIAEQDARNQEAIERLRQQTVDLMNRLRGMDAVNAGPAHDFETDPSLCQHDAGPWTRITGQRRTHCCTHASEQLRCETCGLQMCRNCRLRFVVMTD